MDNKNRQALYREIWQEAVHLGTEEKIFPFGKKNHRIELIPDKENGFDPCAVRIILRTNEGEVLSRFDGRDMGYIPARISKYIKENLEMFTGGVILKVKNLYHKKYYEAKILLSYGDTLMVNNRSMNRFSAILEE